MKGVEMIKLLLLLLLSVSICRADSGTVKNGGTVFLKDAESYVGQAPMLPKAKPTASPSPKITPTPAPTPATSDPEESENAVAEKSYPPAIIHRSSINVGQQIPVPTQYSPPQIVQGQNAAYTVIPATPTVFGTIQTGTTSEADGSGNTSFRDTQLNGFVNYGSPIRTLTPVVNPAGQPMGTKVITISPNRILAPVTTTIQMSQ